VTRKESAAPGWLDSAAAVSWRTLVVAAAAFLVVSVLSRLAVVVLPVIGALFMSVILVPPARWLRRHGWPPLLATWAVFLFAGTAFSLMGGWLVPAVGQQFGPLRQNLGSGLDVIRQWLINGPLHLSGAQVQGYFDDLRTHLVSGAAGGASGPDIVRGAVSGVRAAAEMTAGLVLTVVLAFFFVKDGQVIGAWLVGRLAPQRAGRLTAVSNRAWRVLTGYVRGSAVNGLVNGALMALGLLVLRVPLVAPIATLTFLGGFFPIVGALIAGVVAALVGLVSSGPRTAVLVVGLTVLIHHVEGYVVGPVVLGRAVRLHKVAVLLALAVGGTLAGAVGAFLAVPTIAIIGAVIDELRTPVVGVAVAEPSPSRGGLGEARNRSKRRPVALPLTPPGTKPPRR
jgi:putative heme transporter